MKAPDIISVFSKRRSKSSAAPIGDADSQVVDDILDPDNTASDVCADSAIRKRHMRYADPAAPCRAMSGRATQGREDRPIAFCMTDHSQALTQASPSSGKNKARRPQSAHLARQVTPGPRDHRQTHRD